MARYNTQKKAKKDGNKYMPHGFERAFYNLNPDQMNLVQDTLMRELGWSISRYYNRLRGVYSYAPHEIVAVEKVFNQLGFDAWTGEKTFINTAEYEPESIK